MQSPKYRDFAYNYPQNAFCILQKFPFSCMATNMASFRSSVVVFNVLATVLMLTAVFLPGMYVNSHKLDFLLLRY